MDYFKEFLRHSYDTSKHVEAADDKDQKFLMNSFKTWNSRHRGVAFLERRELSHNQILFVDFGLAYSPELAYSHPCLLLSYDNRLCKVLPITSSPRIVNNAYHPVINPNGNDSYYLIPEGTSALSSESAVYVRQLRTISESRIIKFIDKKGLPIELYKDIRLKSFSECFEDIAYQMQMLRKRNEELEKENLCLKTTAEE